MPLTISAVLFLFSAIDLYTTTSYSAFDFVYQLHLLFYFLCNFTSIIKARKRIKKIINLIKTLEQRLVKSPFFGTTKCIIL